MSFTYAVVCVSDYCARLPICIPVLRHQYGAYLALATPDTRDLRFFGEVFSFYFQHCLLVGACAHLICFFHNYLYSRAAGCVFDT